MKEKEFMCRECSGSFDSVITLCSKCYDSIYKRMQELRYSAEKPTPNYSFENQKGLYTRKNIASILEMQNSLLEAIHAAGGVVSWEKLKTWSLLDLLYKLGSNDIRFVYKEPKDND